MLFRSGVLQIGDHKTNRTCASSTKPSCHGVRVVIVLTPLRGKELFGQNVNELCLVPNVKIPSKFKVPEFEKCKGNTCPRAHLVMYVRRMSTHTDDQRLLIHFFQDSLIGATLKWYMSMDSANIHTFNDLGEAFIKQYKYNMDMAPDRDHLRAMVQKDRESFKSMRRDGAKWLPK